MTALRLPAAVLIAIALAGCQTTADTPGGALVANKTIRLAPSTSIALEKIVNWGLYAGVAYLVLDPLAPNWEIEAAPLDDGHVHLSLKMRRYYAGGAGEARQVFHRRAKELVRLNGFDGYQVLEYSEAMESSVLGSQRTAMGVVRLTREPAKSRPPA